MEESEHSIAQITLAIPLGEQAETKVVWSKNMPRYYKIGNGVRNTFMGREHVPIDTINEIADMTPQELWVLKKVKDNLILIVEETSNGTKRRTSCKAVVRSSSMTNAEQQKFKKGFARLRKKNLLKREKREHYIFNPNFIIPHFYDKELELFISIVK